jgi:hypothetical protein
MFAIIRAWQLVGARNTSLLSAVAGLAQRPAADGTQLPAGEQAGHLAQPDQAASLDLPE